MFVYTFATGAAARESGMGFGFPTKFITHFFASLYLLIQSADITSESLKYLETSKSLIITVKAKVFHF